MRRAAPTSTDAPATPATWAFALGGGLVAAGSIAGMLAAGSPMRRVLAGLSVAGLAAAGAAVPLWRAQREVRHLRGELAEVGRTTAEPPPTPPPAPAGSEDAGDTALRELVARGAHDLRTPLNTLTGMVDTLIARGDQLSPAQREEIEAALQRSTRRVAGWITALLDAAVGRASGQAPVQPSRLQPLVDEAVAVSHAATAGMEVHVVPTDLHVLADPGGVVRVVSNLLANAGHHGRDGDSVEVEARSVGDQVEVFIRDHGSGWATDSSQVGDRPTAGQAHYAGLGLGLASVRSQVAGWGGALELEETPGGGATVRFTLPRASAAEVDDDDDGAGEQNWTIAGRQSFLRDRQDTR